MICEELEREITSETCAAMKKHSWCERSCEERKAILKVPEALPEIIAQDGQISTITPKEVQSTSETTKTILGRSGKPKGKIEGYCQRRKEKLVWNACLQRKHRKIGLCESCNPNTEFLFSEQPMGQGWHNSAARAGEMVCPELDGRKIKKSTCIMRQGKKRKAGKSCDCDFWKGEKIVGETKMKNQECAICHIEFVGTGEICGSCMRGEKLERALITMWCPTCQTEIMGVLGQVNHCKKCDAELQERHPAVEPTYFFCPTPYCANKVEAEGMRCGDCQIEALKKVESQKNPCPPDNSYERHILSTEPVKPNHHIQLIGISETLQKKLEAHKQAIEDIKHWTELLKNLEAEIVAELQKAVKEKEDRS